MAHKSWEALATLLAFPKCTLGLPHRGGKKGKDEASRLVRQRVACFQEQGWLACLAQMPGTREQPRRKRQRPEGASLESKTLDKGFQRTLQGLLDDGAFSKAARHLLSEGVHDPADEGVRLELAKLHPSREPVAERYPGLAWDVDDSPEGRRARVKLLRATVLKFPLGSAGGPSGLRPQH